MKIKKNKSYIIAEIGINHEGDYKIAKKLIINAAKAGADAVKFQLFKPKTLAGFHSKKTSDQYKNTRKSENLTKMWERMQLSYEKLLRLKKISKKLSLDFICSVFDKESLMIANKIKIDAIKMASSDLNDFKLIKELKSFRKEIIISTGMGSANEIKKTLKYIGKKKIILLHCVSLYPCKNELINLNRMKTLKRKFKVPVGYSDHSIGNNACIAAIVLGAQVIEKHFTINKNRKGADHVLSANKSDLTKICDFSKKLNTILGSGSIEPSRSEKKMRKFFRKSIFARKKLLKNNFIKASDIETRRPGKFLSSDKFFSIIGKKIKRNIHIDNPIKKKDLI